MSRSKDTRVVFSSQSLISQAKVRIDAATLHATDRDELRRMLRTTEDKLWEIKKEVPIARRGRGRKKPSFSLNSNAKTIADYEMLIDFLKKAITAHEEIFLTAKGVQPRKFMGRVLNFFTDCINKLCGKWHILERWYKDARNILTNIKQNAEKLQRFRFARA